ncbi:MAG: hypothetical protein HFI40_01400 [Lachnospiraceae bacterium]|nr:hypothetical protein [Lachnospiraceae bacterium]
MRNRSWKKAGHRLLAGALAFACVCAAGNIPVKAAKAKAAPETSVVEQIWQEVVEEYGLKQEETELVYQTDAMGRSTQVPEAVKSETVDENGNVAVTYYVPYVLNEDEKLVNVFEYWADNDSMPRSSSGTFTGWNIIFSYTVNCMTRFQDANVGTIKFFVPQSFSISYSLGKSGFLEKEIVEIRQMTAQYDTVCNLYKAPECLSIADPPAAYTDYNVYATIVKNPPVEGTTYYAVVTNMPNGYYAHLFNYFQTTGIYATITYVTSKGNVGTTTLSTPVDN